MRQLKDGLIYEAKNSVLLPAFLDEQVASRAGDSKQAVWKAILSFVNFKENEEKPISPHEIDSPNSEITKVIFKLYSMDTYLPMVLNHANRTQDQNKIMSLGPFAYLLN